ncbi:MAG: glycosyltransferase [Gallionella sp.]|jgi:hypothetical protein|nr:glycosyltransferase [Gallionella sp.]
MDIALLDPGLHSSAGHHLDLDIKIVRELKQRGHRVSVFAHKKLDARAADQLKSADRVTPLFRVTPYRTPVLIEPGLVPAFFDPLSGSLSLFIDGAKAVAEDLGAVKGFDLWLWPSLFASHLLACADASPATRVSGCIHVEPEFNLKNGQTFWRYAFSRAMDVGLPFNAGILTPELASAYATVCPEFPPQLWPCFFDGVVPPQQRNKMTRIGFFGHQQRQEKGYNLISPIVAKLLESGYQVLLQDSGGSISPSTHERLEVLGHVEDLGQQIRRCDLVVAPYHPAAYRIRGSGIVWEALANGIPLVVPDQTSPGNLIAALGCGRLFGEFSTESILDAIRTVHADYRVVSSLAHVAAQRWADHQGISRFVDQLLSTERR